MVESVPCLSSRYDLQGSIGHGSFGMIYKAIDRSTGEVVAIKSLRKPPVSDFGTWQSLKRELYLAKKLSHQNIARFYDVIEDGDDVYIVMEYLSGGSLLTYANTHPNRNEDINCEIFCQLLNGLDYLHNVARVVHRDIKLENIMFDANHVPKFIDFGFARTFSEDDQYLSTICGSLFYVPPEMIHERKYDKSADIWSLGVVLFGLVTGRLPFYNTSTLELVEAITTKEPHYSRNTSANLRDLLSLMLIKDPSKRITIEEIKRHPWVAPTRARFSAVERSMGQLPPLKGLRLLSPGCFNGRTQPKSTLMSYTGRVAVPVGFRRRVHMFNKKQAEQH